MSESTLSHDLTVDFCGIELKHPVINGSGTFDVPAAVETFGDSVIDRFPFSCFVSKTITVDPRMGNLPPRLRETSNGLINSIGLPNKGLEGFITSDLPRLSELTVPLMVSVAGFSDDEFKILVRDVSEQPDVDALELNISCPNVKSGCIYGTDPEETERLLSQVRGLTSKPIVVKLTPNAPDIAAVGVGAERGGADALSLINTVQVTNSDTDISSLQTGMTGGLSGPTVKETALSAVRSVAKEVQLPLIGMGGISDGESAYEFFREGCRCIAVGTENFRDPLAATRIVSELRKGIASAQQS